MKLMILTPVLLLALAAQAAESQAVAIFLKIDGIEGESAAPGHAGEIDVRSFSLAAESHGPNKPSFRDLAITKWVDRATPALLTACAAGKPLRRVVLTVVRKGDGTTRLVSYELENVIVTSVGHGSASDRPTEEVTLSFERIRVSYTPLHVTGGAGPPVTAG
jgi:type VI secretion system secreted protein Hcp